MTTFDLRPTAHLEHLNAEVDRLADLATGNTAPEELTTAARERTIVATLRLDGSPVQSLTDHLEVPEAEHGSGSAYTSKPSSWYGSFELLEDAPDERIITLEVQGATSAYASDDLIDQLTDDPLTALGELHRRLTRGLLAPERAGVPRTTDQAVQDSSIGRVVYFTVLPDRVPEELLRLTSWLAGSATELPPLHAAGLLHLEVLRIHPFEAANGRLARAAARLWLRRGGLDPQGLAVAEEALAADPLGYHEEVAGTLRRRDAGIWLERWGDAVAAGLRRSAREAGWLNVELPRRSRSFVDTRSPGETFTVADYRTHASENEASNDDASDDGTRDDGAADGELTALLDAGVISRVPGSRGLRFVVN